MNFLDRAISLVSPSLALDRAVARGQLRMFGYDSAEDKTRRGSSGGMSKNSASESPRMARNRLELLWSARDLERNMPVARCVIDRLSQYVCGTIKYQSRTGNAQCDAMYEAYFEDWMRRVADVTRRHDFRTIARLAFRGAYRDGDYFLQLVRQGGVLQVRCVEADRIGDPNKVGSGTDPNLIQGIRIDAVGAPVSYQVFNRDPRSSRYTFDMDVPAKDMIHLMNPIRADEYRTVSALAPVLGQLRDLYEMFNCELGAAKWAASISGVVRSSDPNFRLSASQAADWEGAATTGASVPSVQAKANTLLRLRPNEDVSVFNTGARPAGAFMNFIELSLRDIAMGLNVPYGFFDMARFGGAVVRLEAMQLQRTFQIHQRNLEFKVLDPVKNAVLENGIAIGAIPPPPSGCDFRKGRWYFGAHLTADTGYDTTANLELLAHGIKTGAQIAGEYGEDFESMSDQLFKEAGYLRDKGSQDGIPLELVAGARFPSATQQLAAVADAAQPPPPAPQLTDVGEGGAKSIQDLLLMSANGTITPEACTALLETVYGFTPELAATVAPKPQKHLMTPPAPAGAPFGSKPAGKTPPTENDDDGS